MPAYAIAAALLVACCWGGNFSANKFALADFSPFLTATLRFALTSMLLAPFMLRYKLPRLRDMLFIAITLVVLHFALIFVAMTMGLSIASVIVATQMGVPFSCVVSAVLYKDYMGPWRSLGLMVAFIGVLIVAGTPNAAAHWQAFMLAMFGAFSWSIANIYLKRLPPTPVLALIFWPGFLALPFLGALTLLFEHQQVAQIMHASRPAWMAIAYSIFCSSIIGYGLWNWLITKYPLSQVVPFSLFIPIAGISAGALIFGEALTWQIILGASLTIVGVTIITVRRPRLAEIEQT